MAVRRAALLAAVALSPLLLCAQGGPVGLPAISTLNALKALPSTQYAYVERLGFTTPGDGGSARYRSSASACPIGTGAGDDGSQVRASNGGCWLADFPPYGADIRVWGGCLTSADSTPAFTAAFIAVNTVYIPPSTVCNISTPIPFSGNSKQLVGGNRGSSIITPTVAMGTVIDWGGTVARSSIQNLTINDPSHLAVSGIHYHNSTGNNFSEILHLDIIGPSTNAIIVDTNAGADVLNIRGLFTNTTPHCLTVADSDLNGSFSDFYCFDGNIILTQTTSVHNEGIRIYDGTILNRNTNQPGIDIRAGLQMTINNVIIDQNNNNCILVDSTSFSISGLRVRDSWCGPATGAIGPNIDGIRINAPNGGFSINDIVFDGMRIQDFTGWGIKSTAFVDGLIQDITFSQNFAQGNTSGDIQLNKGLRYNLINNRLTSAAASLVENAPGGTANTILGGYFLTNPVLATGTEIIGTNFLENVFYTYAFSFTNGNALNPTTSAGCGTSPVFVTGSNDVAGSFTAGAGAGTCQLGFRTLKPQAPVCSAHDDSTGAILPIAGSSVAGFNILSVVAAHVIFYTCIGYK
jgi:hypothetical protein